jgi:RNA polymerase sigma-70 factor, ECF subfamily
MDRDLITRAQHGDAEAFEEIVKSRLGSCYATCLSELRSPEDARDATQDALVTAWRRLPTLRDPDRFDGWLKAIAVNASRDILRRRRGVREVPIDDDTVAIVEAPTGGRADIEAALGQLPIGGRLVAERYYLRDEPLREISVGLGVPVGTVKSRLFHARRALRAFLAKE